jgi:hypothetical protein
VASTDRLIGAMATLTLVLVGVFLFRCRRKNQQRFDDRDDEEAEEVFHTELDPAPIMAAMNGETTNTTSRHSPCFRWGGRMKGECRVGVEDNIPRIIQSDSFS